MPIVVPIQDKAIVTLHTIINYAVGFNDGNIVLGDRLVVSPGQWDQDVLKAREFEIAPVYHCLAKVGRDSM